MQAGERPDFLAFILTLGPIFGKGWYRVQVIGYSHTWRIYRPMQLADRPHPAHSNVAYSVPRSLSEPNQATYQRLKVSLSLNLRRQVFIAVCDDLTLRNRLAARLYAQFAYPTDRRGTLPTAQLAAAIVHHGLIGMPSVEHSSTLEYPRFVNLALNLSQPDVMGQIQRWLRRYPPPQSGKQRCQTPGFQLLGTEHLTRQPAFVQQEFLNHLQELGRSLQFLDSTLLVWLTRPWFHAMQQSAPAFWNCHTALFEFEGDPTPVPTRSRKASPWAALSASPSPPPAPTTSSIVSEHPVPPATPVTPQPATTDMAASDQLWELLVADLDLLDESKDNSATADRSLPLHSAAAIPNLLPLEEPPAPLSEPDRATDSSPAVLEPKPAVAVEAEVRRDVGRDVGQVGVNDLPAIVSQRYPDLAALVHAAGLLSPDGQPAATDAAAIALLEQLEPLHQQGVVGTPLATVYQSLGNLYRDRIEQGNGSEAVLLVAISAYERLLANLDDRTAVLWADVLNDLGNLYWMLARQIPDAETSLLYLEAAISAYQLALTQTEPQSRAQNYAMIQNNLGSAYGDLARYRDPSSTLERSVQAYEAALRYRTAEADPARYAATQNNLGTAYWNLAQHQQPVLRLQQAIAAYHEALSYYSEAREPLHYAMIQNNLGTAYWNLAQYEQPANGKRTESVELLNAAVQAYLIALTYRTMEVSPAAHAATQNNLGTAYWHLANLPSLAAAERRSHLQQAIAAYQAALAAVQFLKTTAVFAPLTFDPFATQNNLGLAYYHLATQQQGRSNSEAATPAASRASQLDLALQHHLQALQGWEQQPEFYEAALSYVAQTLRAFNSECGMNAQNQALSKIPAQLLPELMKRI